MAVYRIWGIVFLIVLFVIVMIFWALVSRPKSAPRRSSTGTSMHFGEHPRNLTALDRGDVLCGLSRNIEI